ncbi:cytochrome C oxidase subunit IV family protein [Terrimonas rubra]|jgi:cytochrome c oxidase subunit IV|uniref:Cytochrome C oxidase subunit IV family protein n=1 Tax=Terrimonas rubra TaxID=1035890 RepID=A0ABW6A2Q9_9BACT
MSSHYDPTKAISSSAAYPEVVEPHHHADDAEFKKRVRKTTILLSVITIIELGIGLLLYAMGHEANHLLILMFKGAVCILTLAKAYYIVSIFMHLGDEIRNFIMTIIVPLLLFIWFIAAFLIDGNSYKNLRNTYDPHFKQTTTPVKHEAKKEPTAPEPGKQ